ncbi:MAG: RNA-binding cell elongation regulator Jag/EloR [Caldibacillus sp.]
MRQVTSTGSTVEDAINQALKELNARKDQVEISIIDEGKRGILGIFGARPAIVKAILKVDPIEEAKKFIIDVCKQMGMDVEVETEIEGRQIYMNIITEKTGLLIGKRGRTLNALQTLTQLVLNKYSDQFLIVILDAENYRDRREKKLRQLAQRLADKVSREKREIQLEPMPSYERRIIHTELADHEHVRTYSIGQDPNRHIVIAPK